VEPKKKGQRKRKREKKRTRQKRGCAWQWPRWRTVNTRGKKGKTGRDQKTNGVRGRPNGGPRAPLEEYTRGGETLGLNGGGRWCGGRIREQNWGERESNWGEDSEEE